MSRRCLLELALAVAAVALALPVAVATVSTETEHRVALLTRRARFEEAAKLLDEPAASELRATAQQFEAAVSRARAALDAPSKALALGEAFNLAPESEVVRDVLATLPADVSSYPLTTTIDPGSGRPTLIYAPRDAAVLTLVAAGEFLLGSARPDALPEEKPQRKLSLPAFYIDRYEVTNRRYARFVAGSGRAPPPHWRGQKVPPAELLDHPVSWVSHQDAVAYAAWAGHRLPTELEWEKAARGSDGRTFPWGEQEIDHWLAEITNLQAGAPVAVASHPLGASPFGCLDMTGNVAEWTSDFYAPYRYLTLIDGSTTPTPTPGYPAKVVRGGTFLDIAEFGRTTFRSFQKPDLRAGLYGFRVARDP